MTGQELKQMIEASGWRKSDIAQKLGMSKQALQGRFNAEAVSSTLVEQVQEIINGIASAPTKRTIRYWVDADATAGELQLYDDTQTANVRYIDINIPEFGDCTDAVNLYGDSMYPLYKSGQIIILKEWVESFIDFGNVYLIITRNGNRMVKYIRKGTHDGCVLCASENPAFEPFEIALTDICKLYIVKGSIKKDTL